MLITPTKALGIILEQVRPLKALRLPLSQATGHCLAEDIRSDRDQPAADRSAMDGFAVRSTDLSSCPRQLRLAGEVAAGSPARPRVRPGTCVRVLTGANVPPGADAVVIVEQTKESDSGVMFSRPVKVGANIRKRGEEAKNRTVLLKKGALLGAVQIGLCATVGKAQPKVYARPRVTVLCTGEELRPVSDRVGRHELRDSNGPSLTAALALWGYQGVTHKVVPDDPKALAAKLKRAVNQHDVVILSGGVSVGKYDFVPQAIKLTGGRIRFHGVAMRPGKPELYATVGRNKHIFGLPGNPLSVMTGFYEFVLPALRRMSGLDLKLCQPCLRLPLAADAQALPKLVRFVVAKLVSNKKGLSLMPIKSHGSGDLISGGTADGVIVLPGKAGKISAGTVVAFRPWRPLP